MGRNNNRIIHRFEIRFIFVDFLLHIGQHQNQRNISYMIHFGTLLQEYENIAVDQKARSTYEYLIDLTEDPAVLAPCDSSENARSCISSVSARLYILQEII